MPDCPELAITNTCRLLGKINAYRISTSGNDDATVHIFRMGSLVEGRTVDIVFENSAPEPIVDDTMSATVNDTHLAIGNLQNHGTSDVNTTDNAR